MAIRLDPVDVLVVGSGMGGAAFCARLAERAPKLRIACLERGGWVDRQAMPPLRRDWQRATLNDWAASPNMRLKSARPSPSADYAIDDTGSPIKPLMWSGVGGSSINWAAHFPRLHPSDFRTRTLDGVGDDWPFDYFDLEPYYDLNDAAMGVCGLAGDPAYPPKPARPMPPLALGRLGDNGGARLRQAWAGIGGRWTRRSTRWRADGRGACNYCGPCQQGCVNSAKASTDLTYWPKAIAAGVELRPNCIAQRIVSRAAGRPASSIAMRRRRACSSPAVMSWSPATASARRGCCSPPTSTARRSGRNLMFHPGGRCAGHVQGRAGRAGGTDRLRAL